jgi:hypothetical protein
VTRGCKYFYISPDARRGNKMREKRQEFLSIGARGCE